MLAKSAVFIDGGYMSKILSKDFGSPRIDYGLFVQWASSGTDMIRAYYYDCLPYQPEAPSEADNIRFAAKQRFFDSLSYIPRFHVRQGRLECRGHRTILDSHGKPTREPILQQKRVDMLMSMDIILHSVKRHIDYVVLVTGDSDFVPLVEAVKAEGAIVRLVHGSTCHADLQKAVDERLRIDEEVIEEVRRREAIRESETDVDTSTAFK